MMCIAVVDFPEPPFSLPRTITCGRFVISRCLQPDGRIMEHRTTIRQTRLCAYQCIHADTSLEGVVRPNTLNHNDSAQHSIEVMSMHHNRCLFITDLHPRTT